MIDDPVDRILSREDDILPSSGFVSSVMEVVRQEAATPPPIPFPWKWAAPGLIALGVALIALLALGARSLSGPSSAAPTASLIVAGMGTLSAALDAAMKSPVTLGLGWMALALLLSLTAVMVSVRLGGLGGSRT
jgi:hypothetical protein